MFDEKSECLTELKEACYSPEVDRELLADVKEILYRSILYRRNKNCAYCVVQTFSKILPETLVYFIENAEYPLTQEVI